MFSPKQKRVSYIVDHSEIIKKNNKNNNKKNSKKRDKLDDTDIIEDKNSNGKIYNKKYCDCCIIN